MKIVRVMPAREREPDEILRNTSVVCAGICRAIEHWAPAFGRQAILNGLLNAYVNVAHAHGVPAESLAKIMRGCADHLAEAYAQLDEAPAPAAEGDLATTAPQGRA